MLVRHPPSVTIVAVEGDTVALVRQQRPGSSGPTVELPAGCLEPGEVAVEAASRELAEECSLGARHWRSVGSFWAAPAYSTEWVEVFEARELYPATGVPDDDEQLTVVRMEIAELPGVLSDATSIAAFSLWAGRQRGPVR